VAYRLLQAGRHKDKYRAEKGSVPILAMKINDENIIVTRDEVKGYVTDPAFGFYLQCYQYTKLWGGINGKGWAEWPSDILEAVTALEYESRAIEKEEMEKAREK
jgi:hypothetical protein